MLITALRYLSHMRLFRRSTPLESSQDIIVWWEARRIPYNLLVGAAGILSCIIILATAFVTEHFTGEPVAFPDPPVFAFFAVVAYAILANVCFTGGWILELISRRVWQGRADAFGEIAFTWGLLGCIAMTLMPAAIVVMFGVTRIVFHSHP